MLCMSIVYLLFTVVLYPLQQGHSSLEVVDVLSIIIGLATFGQIAGLLRFLSYLEKYNILLITLRVALPSVLRFIACGGVLYIAFLLCGWLVLGPYHAKVQGLGGGSLLLCVSTCICCTKFMCTVFIVCFVYQCCHHWLAISFLILKMSTGHPQCS